MTPPHAAAGIAERAKFVKCSAMRAIVVVVVVEPTSIGGMSVMALGGTGVGAACVRRTRFRGA
jgi:hypothetical protein